MEGATSLSGWEKCYTFLREVELWIGERGIPHLDHDAFKGGGDLGSQ